MPIFALASLAPLALLALGVAFGGAWAFAGLVYMAILTALLDRLITRVAPDAPEGREFPAADALLIVLGGAHLAALPVAVWAIAGDSGLAPLARMALFLGFGQYFGQISNPCAHELIHRGNRAMFQLGRAVYTSMLFGHHTSAHRLVHHRHVCTDRDPNTARLGESYYHFVPRAWIGSFRAGLAAENLLRGHGVGSLHPYAIYVGGAALSLALGFAIAGLSGLLVWAALAGYATAQLLLSDYVQHYGLSRSIGADGKPESVGDQHSWNAPQWFSAHVMLNAPRHSDHHAHPARPYPALRLPPEAEAPRLPYSLPLCCLIALSPRLWRRMMAKALARRAQSGSSP